MFQITKAEQHTDTIFSREIRSAPIAKAVLPGQFVIVTVNPNEPPLPLPISDFNRQNDTFTVTCEAADPLRQHLMSLQKGDSVFDCTGPFAEPSRIDTLNTVVCIAGGIGSAALFPLVREYKSNDCDVISIVGFKTADKIFLNKQISKHSDEFYVTTNDGSYGIKGRVTTALRAILQSNKDIERVVVIGSLQMMKACVNITAAHEIPTRVSLAAMIADDIWRSGRMQIAKEPQQSLSFMERLEFDAKQLDLESLITLEKQHAETEEETLPEETDAS
ncbi:MAG: hypothetical protein ABIA59_00180 [Candidatus Latescibacterota bacterium]